MIKKALKKVALSLLALTLMIPVIADAQFVKAEGFDEIGTVLDGSVLTSETSAEAYVTPKARGSFLGYGTTKISNAGSGSANISGATVCSQTCTTVKLYITLQRKVNGSWTNYNSWSYSASNTSLLSKGFTYSVPRGYYYRLKGAHTATKNGVTETVSSYTDGIYIS